MDSDFWHKKWEDNQIGFHRSSVNPLLVRPEGTNPYFN